MNLINLDRKLEKIQTTKKQMSRNTNYFDNLNAILVSSETFFSDKSKAMNTVVLYEKGKIIKAHSKS